MASRTHALHGPDVPPSGQLLHRLEGEQPFTQFFELKELPADRTPSSLVRVGTDPCCQGKWTFGSLRASGGFEHIKRKE